MHLFDDDDAIQGGQALVCRIDAKVRWLLEAYFLNQWIKDSWAVLAISVSESEASVHAPGGRLTNLKRTIWSKNNVFFEVRTTVE